VGHVGRVGFRRTVQGVAEGRRTGVRELRRHRRVEGGLAIVRVVLCAISVATAFTAQNGDLSTTREVLLGLALGVPALPLVMVAWRLRSEAAARRFAIVASAADIALYGLIASQLQHDPGAGGLIGVLAIIAAPIRLGAPGALVGGASIAAIATAFPQDRTDGTTQSTAYTVLICAFISAAAWLISAWLRRTTEAVERIEHLFRAAFDQASNGLAIVGIDGRIVEANRAAANLLGLGGSGPAEATLADLTGFDAFELDSQLAAIASGASPGIRREVVVPSASGRERQLVLSLGTVPSQGRNPVLLLQIDDVTERRQVEADLAHRATHDTLTRLPNRELLLEHLTDGLDAGQALALAVLDLDGFKEINDRHGHAAGDRVLTIVADRLRRLVRPSDLVARLSGDEFVVLCPNVDAEAAAELASRIAAAVGQPMDVDGVEMHVEVSVGIAFSDASGAEALLARADHAMYQMKSRRRRQRELLRQRTIAATAR
jgi:diguanylate cyclase (GGDEF)-like protein/PAS domain S-box-containing protein